jgi:hypothetical protein
MDCPRPLLRAALVALLAAAPALAHEGAVLDLEAMESHVAARAAETTGPEHDAYARLETKLAKPTREKLLRDLAKLDAAGEALAGALAEDATLRGLLTADADEAETALLAERDAAEQQLTKIGRAKHRVRVAAVIDEADAIRADAHAARDTADERPALNLMKRSVRRYRAAVALAKRLRRSVTFPQFKAPAR